MIHIYPDTSVVSCIDAPDTPEREEITRCFFRLIQNNPSEYELLISPVLVNELDFSPEQRRTLLRDFLETQIHTRIVENSESTVLARKLIRAGVLTKNHINDLTHIAYAVLTNCDYVVSWNMKHFVHQPTIQRVNHTLQKLGLPNVTIITPKTFLERQNEDH